ncbi:hypothetical protein [Empedobacter brevis]|uniref:hypothetical protein n=1 Tax=Empedobacter brevis TaxID=247 RepID=UPI0013201B53|nr:hypothetical protein [Empedobacter brevis]QHC84545.1 hypothetical protein AS589_06950 [Empedobacter brevis]
MKIRFTFLGFFLLSAFGFAQISTTRMNEFKIGMRPAEIMKLLGNKPVALANESEKNISLKGIHYTIYIGSGYLSKTEGDAYVNSISTSSKNIQTLSGIGVGSSLEDLWKVYSTKYNVFLNRSENNLREFRIDDKENGTILLFDLKNEIVTKITINSYNPEECFL